MWDYKTHAPKKFNGQMRKNEKQKRKWCMKDRSQALINVDLDTFTSQKFTNQGYFLDTVWRMGIPDQFRGALWAFTIPDNFAVTEELYRHNLETSK